MKKILIISVLFFASISTFAQQVMKKQSDGTYVVNTTTIAQDVKGYKGTTPVEVYIKNGTIIKVVPLENNETPRFFDRVKQELLPKFTKLSLKKYSKKEIDAVTGATYSSNAVKENVKRAVEYYNKSK